MSDSASPSATVPGWLAFVGSIGWRLLVVCGLVAVILGVAVLLWSVTLSVIVAILLVAAVLPLVTRLLAGGRSRTVAAALGTLAVIGVVTAALLVAVLALVPSLAALLASIQDGLADLAELAATAGMPPQVSDAITELRTSIQDWLRSGVLTAATTASFWATVGVLAGFLTFFFLQGGEGGWAWCIQAAAGPERDRLSAAGADGLARAGGHLRRTASRSALDAAVVLIALAVLGVPYAGALAVLMLLGGFVPYVGRVSVAAALGLVALTTVGAGIAALLILGLLVGAIVEQVLVVPHLPGSPARLHPIAVLVGLPAGASIAGIAGLVVVVPLTVLLVVVGGAVVAVLDAAAGTTPRPPVLPGVPFWLDRAAQWSWRLLVAFALGAVGVAIVAQLSGLVLALVIAAVLAASLVPLAELLRARGVSRGTAALAATVGGSVTVGVIVAVTVLGLAAGIREIVPEAGSAADQIRDALGDQAAWVGELVADVGGELVRLAGRITTQAAGVVVVALIGVLLGFFLLRDGGTVWRHAANRLPAGRRDDFHAAGRRAVGVLGGYMVGTGVISGFGAVTQWAIMVVLGLPLALPLAIFAFFAGFIPYIGSFLATGAAFLVAVGAGQPIDIVVMAVFTIVFNIVQGSFIAPIVYGRVASIHPAVVLVAIPAGSAIAGVLGMFMAVPIIGIVATTWRSALRILDPGNGDIPVPELVAEPARAREPGDPTESPAPELEIAPLSEPEPGA